MSKCLHWNGKIFETIKVLSGNWNTLILRVSNPPNPLFGLNIWHQYFMDLNENFSRSCHDWTWFVFPNYILNGWKSFWQFMWQPLKSFLLLKKHLYFFMVIWVHIIYVSLGFFLDHTKHVFIPQKSVYGTKLENMSRKHVFQIRHFFLTIPNMFSSLKPQSNNVQIKVVEGDSNDEVWP